ncbi:MAG TPA: GH92 family glycosyl hydrolase [Dongiaceae bacterium]|nr:GH92 family glycosyl hydrolase [Dongiaceae bacterium]
MKTLLTPLLVLSALWLTTPARAQVEWVDPTIGGQGFMLEPTRPTVHLPNSMVRVYPVRKDQLDDQIQSFPLFLIGHRGGELFWLLPADGTTPANTWEQPQAYDQEVTTPYYYSTRFDDSLIQTEFTPAARSGYFRFTFPAGQPVLVLANRQPGDLSFDGTNAVSGSEKFNHMQGYIYGEFSAPVTVQSSGAEQKRLVITATAGTKSLEFRYGVSYISVAQARKNLQEEIPGWTFDAVKTAAKQRWNEVLGQVHVEGGTPAQRRVFYTSLYRCYERMVNITEDGQYYSAFDHQVHQDSRPFYVDNWIWDMYRALEPLHLLLNPEMEADQVQSYVRMYEQSGWMPSFAVVWGDMPCMTGNHAAAWMADAWAKGVRNFDVKTAYAGLKKNSLEATILPWRNGPKTSLDDFYNEHGYMPALHPGEKETVPEVHSFERRQAVSVTLENSYDDWCIAQLARASGNAADYSLFTNRAAFYQNVFRRDKQSVWPKDSAGNWIEPYDPKFSGGMGGRDYTTENNGYTYDWDAQQDLQGLFGLMGGRVAAEAKLDQLFRESLDRSKYEFWSKFPDASGLVGQFSMGNEPSFHIPYIYNYLGAPWKTQKRVRMLLDTWFTDTTLGIPGDEDGGGMTAFVVFSMMGLYPVTPGMPVYDLTGPVFDRIDIRLHNGKTFSIVCPNNSRDNKYLQSIKLNGQVQSRVWLRHSDILKGGTLELQMGNTPNKALGSNPADLPPSQLSMDPRDFESAGQ